MVRLSIWASGRREQGGEGSKGRSGTGCERVPNKSKETGRVELV